MCNCFTLSLPLLVAERTIATLKLHDYEKTVYKFCLPAVVMTSWIGGGLAGMIARLGDPCFYAVMTFEISINIVAICVFFYLDHICHSKYKANKLTKCQYSLTVQFQLAENIRYARLIKRCAVFLTLSVCCEVLALTIAETISGFKIKGAMSIGMHYAIIFCAVVFSIFGLTSIEQYKIKFIK
uniref:Uncharacterized protein n=1 Tax=Panagrolaimus sp. JU765 TaxID=591449 RepID=A0AC34R4I5_9BILA